MKPVPDYDSVVNVMQLFSFGCVDIYTHGVQTQNAFPSPPKSQSGTFWLHHTCSNTAFTF